MTFPKLLAVLSLGIVTSAGSMVLLEQRTAAPTGFVRQGAAPANNTLTLRVALTSNNVAGLQEKLRSIATPGTSDFRQWLSKDEVCTFVWISIRNDGSTFHRSKLSLNRPPRPSLLLILLHPPTALCPLLYLRTEIGSRLPSLSLRQTNSSPHSLSFSRTPLSQSLSRAHSLCRCRLSWLGMSTWFIPPLHSSRLMFV